MKSPVHVEAASDYCSLHAVTSSVGDLSVTVHKHGKMYFYLFYTIKNSVGLLKDLGDFGEK